MKTTILTKIQEADRSKHPTETDNIPRKDYKQIELLLEEDKKSPMSQLYIYLVHFLLITNRKLQDTTPGRCYGCTGANIFTMSSCFYE